MSTRAVTFEEYRALLAEVLKLKRQTFVAISGGGGGGGPAPSGTVADLDGTNDPGVAVTYSRGDHKHGDTNRPTDDEKGALTGTGTPSAGNPYVTADSLTAAVPGQKNSIEVDAGDLQLVGDTASPGTNKVYGTNGSGVRGWKADPTSTGTPSSTVEDLDGTNDPGVSTDYSRGDHKHADPNRPTDDQKDALVGTGTPSASNKYVTEDTLAASTGLMCSPLTDGDLTEPELIFASGDVIMVCV